MRGIAVRPISFRDDCGLQFGRQRERDIDAVLMVLKFEPAIAHLIGTDPGDIARQRELTSGPRCRSTNICSRFFTVRSSSGGGLFVGEASLQIRL